MAKKKTAKKPVKKSAPKKVAPKKGTPKKTAAKKTAAPKKSAKPAPVKTETPKAKKQSVSHLLSPLDNRVLVDVTPGEQKTAGGLFIPASVSMNSTRGKVIAVGRGRRDKKGKILSMDVSVGDEVIWADYAGMKVTLSNREVLILREDEILGIVN